jgi:hypothetical protein
MRWLYLSIELEPLLRQGDIDGCSERVTSALRSLPPSPFHLVTELQFANDIHSVARYFDDIIETSEEKFEVKAIYTETNGFSINPDRWFFSACTYSIYGGHEDYDWLSDCQYEDLNLVTLTGMEPLQEVYASSAFRDPAYKDARGYASLLVVLRFQALIRSSARWMRRLRVPLLATSHDYDFIYEYDPATQR